jgi:hypothetical protein
MVFVCFCNPLVILARPVFDDGSLHLILFTSAGARVLPQSLKKLLNIIRSSCGPNNIALYGIRVWRCVISAGARMLRQDPPECLSFFINGLTFVSVVLWHLCRRTCASPRPSGVPVSLYQCPFILFHGFVTPLQALACFSKTLRSAYHFSYMA